MFLPEGALEESAEFSGEPGVGAIGVDSLPKPRTHSQNEDVRLELSKLSVAAFSANSEAVEHSNTIQQVGALSNAKKNIKITEGPKI